VDGHYLNTVSAWRKQRYFISISQLLFRWAEKKYSEASNAGTARKNPIKGKTVTPLNKKPTAVKRKNNPIPALDIRSTIHIFLFMGSPRRQTSHIVLLQKIQTNDLKALIQSKIQIKTRMKKVKNATQRNKLPLFVEPVCRCLFL
jgi:hypothetical protein